MRRDSGGVAWPLTKRAYAVEALSTVGYGDITPLTPEGKLASVVLMLLGIGLYSAILATVTGAMLTGGAPAKPDAVARMDSLDALHAAGVTQPEYDAKRAKILDDL